jgi:hypothetical protein
LSQIPDEHFLETSRAFGFCFSGIWLRASWNSPDAYG